MGSLPYIVASRSCKSLLQNLNKDNFPIFYEGLHTTALLHFVNFGERIQLVRMHNIEHDYYNGLAHATSNIFKKYYYLSESRKLKKYEKVLAKADAIFAISEMDNKYFKKIYNNSLLLPAFHSNEKIKVKPGRGEYILYHGNLSVDENEKAVLFLINNVFSKINHTCIIAGKSPSKLLTKLISKYEHIKIVANPDQNEMTDFIMNAHIIILPTFQPTGIKLKLIDSVFNGRYCIVNKAMVNNTGLEEITVIADQEEQMIDSINHIMEQSISQSEINKRKYILDEKFSNQENIKIITNFLKY